MKKQQIFIFILLFFSTLGCEQSKKDKAFKVFNEGVSLSLDAGNLVGQGHDDDVKNLYEQAIKKFKEALEIDNSHYAAYSPIGFSNYEIRNYDEAAIYFEKAISVDSASALNYQYLGLSQINKGNVEDGEKNINKAFELDKGEEIRSVTIENLTNIGNLAYTYGEGWEKEGNTEKGMSYKKFGVRVLLSAFEYSKQDNKIGKMIKEYAVKLNDKSLLDWIKNKMK
jgi:tetratricopeptide (TPR) repeat protein